MLRLGTWGVLVATPPLPVLQDGMEITVPAVVTPTAVREHMAWALSLWRLTI